MALTANAIDYLRDNHPHLADLRKRYTKVGKPMASHTLWGHEYLRRELELPFFREDNPYVWQVRNWRESSRIRYFLFMQYVQGLDTRGLMQSLREDGAFGCVTYQYHGMPLVSRDLLDSINELYFLDRVWGLFGREQFSVIDIGAGYGRLAHRMSEACRGLSCYYCVDAVPESTFLSEFYIRHRGLQEKVVVVPLDELDRRIPGAKPDLAINIHSFSEMPLHAIEGWISWLHSLRVPELFVVPNHKQELLSTEANAERRDFLPVLERYGYQLTHCEPIFADQNVRELVGVDDHFFFFRKEGA